MKSKSRCFRPDFETIFFQKHRNSWRDILKGPSSLKYLIKLLPQPTRKVFYLFMHRVYNSTGEFLLYEMKESLRIDYIVQKVLSRIKKKEKSIEIFKKLIGKLYSKSKSYIPLYRKFN